MPIADDDIRGALARAEEIQAASGRRDALAVEFEAIIAAAGEVGIGRPAVERALRERLGLPVTPPVPGDLVFAKSADGKYYVAEVRTAAPDGFGVRFLRGSEHTIAADEVRPASFLPGERVVCPWPMWGPWTCTIISYDADQRLVVVSDGWTETRAFPIEQVWLKAPRKRGPGQTRARVYATLLGAGAAAGALIGSILTALILAG